MFYLVRQGIVVNSDISPASASCIARIRSIQNHFYTPVFTTRPYVCVHLNYISRRTKLLNVCVDSFHVHVILLIWNTYVKWNLRIKGNILNFDRHCFISPLKDFNQHHVEKIFPYISFKALGMIKLFNFYDCAWQWWNFSTLIYVIWVLMEVKNIL